MRPAAVALIEKRYGVRSEPHRVQRRFGRETRESPSGIVHTSAAKAIPPPAKCEGG